MTPRLQPWRLRRLLSRTSRLLRPPALGFLVRRILRPDLVPSALRAAHFRATPVRTALYRLWIREHESCALPPAGDRPTEASMDRARSVLPEVETSPETAPEFSLLVSGGRDDPDGLRRTLASVRGQSHSSWELHVAEDVEPVSETPLTHLASGELLLHLTAGDELAPDALARMSGLFRRHPEAELAYGDEDHIGPDGGRLAPWFKPDWNPELFWASGYLGSAVVLRRRLVAKVAEVVMGALPMAHQELVSRSVAILPGERIRHLPGILLHRGASTTRLLDDFQTTEGDRAALVEKLLSKEGRRVRAETGPLPGTLRLRWPLPAELPRASLVVLTRNGRELLERCLAGIRAKTRYAEYEIVVVDHSSDEPATLELLRRLHASEDIEVLRREGEFNFSALNNHAVGKARGELLVFLNNDVEILTAGWLEEMASHALRPDVGAVGARLLYPDGRLQHGGVLLGGGAPTDAVAGHLSHGIRRDDPGYFGRARLTQEVSAVTAACMVMRREVFDQVGRFDERDLPVAFNDVDLCLRIRAAGYRIVWTPWAEAVHHESATRGDDLAGESRQRFLREVHLMRRRWGDRLEDDPFYNPNLDPIDCDFALAFPPRARD